MINRIIAWIKKILEIDYLHKRISVCEVTIKKLQSQSFIGVDYNRNATTTICIVSRINGGRVHVIDTYVEHVTELRELVVFLEGKYGVSPRNRIIDSPDVFIGL